VCGGGGDVGYVGFVRFLRPLPHPFTALFFFPFCRPPSLASLRSSYFPLLYELSTSTASPTSPAETTTVRSPFLLLPSRTLPSRKGDTLTSFLFKVRPEWTDTLAIKAGRHPLHEQFRMADGSFVPKCVELSCSSPLSTSREDCSLIEVGFLVAQRHLRFRRCLVPARLRG
jgi:hypothetical protein